MAKAKTAYVCAECGASFNKWQGQCGDCGAWNTLVRIRGRAGRGGPRARRATPATRARSTRRRSPPLQQVSQVAEVRVSTGIGELDRVLGGGLVEGSVVLVGGDPGIGKSTLLLQALAAMGGRLPALYVTGEESLSQVAGRATRLGLPLDGLDALAETGVEKILALVGGRPKPKLIVADSIQTLWSEQLTAAPGSVSQVRESAARLVRFAKETGTSVFLVGHVTKDGGIAGPRVLEHMVDAVLYFEGESGSRFRILRAFKNRFGAVNELGVFAMSDKGLREVPNPSAIFLSGAQGPTPGSVVMVTREGTRPLLVEVQALVDHSPLSNPRRVTLGLEQNRLAMLLAVLHRHGGVGVFDQDVFVNVVGGIRVQETAADLPVLLAVLQFAARPAAGRKDRRLRRSRPVRRDPAGAQWRGAAAAKRRRTVFAARIVPKANAPKKGRVGEMEVVARGAPVGSAGGRLVSRL